MGKCFPCYCYCYYKSGPHLGCCLAATTAMYNGASRPAMLKANTNCMVGQRMYLFLSADGQIHRTMNEPLDWSSCCLRIWTKIHTVAYIRIYGVFRCEARLHGLCMYLERGQTLRLRPFRSPQWLLSCTNKHCQMAGTRSPGELLPGGAVRQRMRSSNSSSTFIAATCWRSHVIHADDSHSAIFLLGPINFEATA
jgi:hypothetical protein